MVSKNNKHGKPKKKYKKRRTSFRNNKKNINLRSKSLKRNKGGAIGDKPSDFGLPSDTSVNLSTLKSLCDKYQYDVDSTEVNPRTMRTNYIIPNAKKWYTGNNVKNAAAFEKARQQRVACYTYYKKAFAFGFFKKIFTSDQKKLADPIYGSYDKLLTEDSIDNQDIKDAKDKYLMACAIAKASKHRAGITLLRYIRSSKSDATSIINRQYKNYLGKLKRLLNKQSRSASSNDKKNYTRRIASIDRLLKSENPINDEFKVKKTKEFIEQLDALKTKQADDKSDNTFVFISFYNDMTNAIGALTLLNTTLLLNGYDDTIVEPPQWFSRKIGNVTIDESFKNMLEPDEQDNLEKYLFGVDAPTSENTNYRLDLYHLINHLNLVYL